MGWCSFEGILCHLRENIAKGTCLLRGFLIWTTIKASPQVYAAHKEKDGFLRARHVFPTAELRSSWKILTGTCSTVQKLPWDERGNSDALRAWMATGMPCLGFLYQNLVRSEAAQEAVWPSASLTGQLAFC